MNIGIAYIPVIHRGYLDFLDVLKKKQINTLYLVGDELLGSEESLDYLNRKDRIRALSTERIKEFASDYMDVEVRELTQETLTELQSTDLTIYTPKEDVGRILAKKYFENKKVMYCDIFLRWNKDNVEEDTEPDVETISASDFQSKVIQLMREEADKSFDWWRQVGAALIKDDQVVLVTHNEHMPDPQYPNVFGDTRALFKKGININYVTSAHAEVGAIATAAKHGIPTEGAELYVTDFPCPYCARLIAKSGIKKLYFQKGYAVLEGDEFLRGEGIEIFKIK